MDGVLYEVTQDFLEKDMEVIFDVNRYEEYKQAAHCAIYSFSDKKVLSKYSVKANVLMVMRFDGTLGFPGGEIPEGENIVDGLIRELKEEINFDTDKYQFCKENYIFTIVNHQEKYCFHFFRLRMLPDEYYEMEKRALLAEDYGDETYGILRVPLYTFNSSRGFPSFLQNNFIENAKFQLLYFLGKEKILPIDELTEAIRNV
ncbi:uncharacterized protein LOC111626044 [Centruroides sculpturatus]|uniref:uncharacterized protein LOC111626044 n=2 Tax=Centruroides sculpturatus TaxID=218467 RepID=UPI000C6DD259|nr:uncharacterized protein LOC111626044 [Centruroides sculpturatus]